MLYVIGPLFHFPSNGAERWHGKDCLLADADLQKLSMKMARMQPLVIYSVAFDSIFSSDTYCFIGELFIKSSFITKGYLQYDSSSFTIKGDSAASFHNGDIYGYVGEQRFAWRGRKEDYIQVCYVKLFIWSF